MKAIILAAGIGSRLRPQTDEIPKCLVKVNEQDSIIDTQIKALKTANIEEIIIITGYRANQIQEYILNKYTELKFTFIENNKYLTTNNMYSFLLAKPYLESQSFVSLNADVALDDQIIKGLLNNPNSNLIAVDKEMFSEESMKVKIGKPTEAVISISKGIEERDAFAVSIDVYKIAKEASNIIFAVAQSVIDSEGENQWFEVALNESFQQIDFATHEIQGLKWFEIDNQEDLLKAKELFK
ncbi:phosphocholine cytidylyltransferase family protein [Sporosarcina sp. FSL K6-2383]|uniref:phosphocholine cytidylyltransferase family protein n=1 Tax=Sporosarcina sp. FSL K6-2383 TaxID=2921556 RepID=UPI00315AE0C5